MTAASDITREMMNGANRDEDEKKEQRGRKRRVGDLLDEFWESSTLQGVPKVFTSRAAFWKTFWILMVLLLLAGCTYQMYSIFVNFYARKTTTSVTVIYGDVDFPTLTICNMNAVRESQLLKSDNQYLVGNYTEFKKRKGDSEYIYQSELYDHIRRMNYSDWASFGHEGEVMIIEPQFLDFLTSRSSAVTYIKYNRVVSSLLGNCFVLNSAQTQEQPFKSNHPGKMEGMRMRLNAQKHEYLYKYAHSTGFLIDIHTFNTTDDVDGIGINLPTGYHHDITIMQTQIHRLEAPYGQCSNEYADSFEELYGYKYTVAACNMSCEHYHIAETCGCYVATKLKLYTQHQLATLRPCNLYPSKDETCIRKKVLSAVYFNKTKQCSCPLPCQETRFDVDISSTPLEYEWDTFEDLNCGAYMYRYERVEECALLRNVSEEEKAAYVRKNFAEVFMYYKELTYTKYTENIAYERSQFISDFGGNLGLWLGASIFTVLEVVELLTKIAVTSAGKKPPHQRNSRDRDQNNTDGAGDTGAVGADVPLKDSVI